MRKRRRVCVFLASGAGTQAIEGATDALADALATQGHRLVYGGANVGLMKRLADRVLGAGGEVTGVLPRNLSEREVAHPGLTDLLIVEGMHARKATMYAFADAFVALPGGFGTMDELFEVLTWKQLDLHQKPVGLLNVDGFFDPLLGFLDGAVRAGVLQPKNRDAVVVGDDPSALLETLLPADGPALEP